MRSICYGLTHPCLDTLSEMRLVRLFSPVVGALGD